MAVRRQSRAGHVYFAAQAVAIGVWWVLALSVPWVARLSFREGFDSSARSAFLLADTGVSVTSSVVAAWGGRASQPAAWAAFGSVAYATLMELTLNAPLFTRPYADIGMVAITVGSLLAARDIART